VADVKVFKIRWPKTEKSALEKIVKNDDHNIDPGVDVNDHNFLRFLPIFC
jgi:hypothetical protein